jgi:hypothetical protein
MVRTLTIGLLLLATARVATADETEKNSPAAAESALVTSAPAPVQSVKATKQRGKQTVRAKTDEDKAYPLAATGQLQQPGGDVKMSGMSILGNEDAPKSLVLVPWKSSQLAEMPTVSRLLDSAAQPVDKDVFMRELAYYEYKSSSK